MLEKSLKVEEQEPEVTTVGYENKDAKSLKEAKRETCSRVKYLAKVCDEEMQASSTPQTRDIVWKILSSFNDWKQWQYEIGNVLYDNKYPEYASIILARCLKAISNDAEDKDDGFYRLARNLVSSLIHFSVANTQFNKAVIESRATKEVLDFLARETFADKPEKRQIIPLVRGCFRLPLEIGYFVHSVWKAVEDACIKSDEDSCEILSAFTKSADEECRCFVYLWYSRLITKHKTLVTSLDTNEVFSVLGKFLDSAISKGNKVFASWIVSGIAIFAQLFVGTSESWQADITKPLVLMVNNAVYYESSCLSKAQQLLCKTATSETEIQPFLKSIQFKDNAEFTTDAEAMRIENISRLTYLRKLHDISSDGIVCLDAANASNLLQDSRLLFQDTTEEWKRGFEDAAMQENFPELAIKYATVLLERDLEMEDLSYEILHAFYRTLWNLCDGSNAARMKAAEVGVVDFLLDRLKDVDGVTKKSASSERWYYVLVSAPVSILYNISRGGSQIKHFFLERNAAKILVPYFDDAKYRKVVQVGLCITYILTDTPDAARLVEEEGIIKIITNMAHEAMHANDRIARTGVGTMWSLDELLDGLLALAKIDDNKAKLMENDAVGLVQYLLLNGSTDEKSYAIELLWTLCFDSAIRNEILANHADDVITPLENLTLADNEEIQKAAKEAISYIEKWAAIEEEQQARLKDQSATAQVVTAKGGHIFLSYSWRQQETVLRIRDELLARKFKVWMDVDKMHGGLLDSMAKAVEDAAVVLLCFSQSYKESNPCRAEAQYAYSLGRKIIPVNMEYRYQADGWLGIMVRPLLYVDMSLVQKPFEASMETLLAEISSFVGPETTCSTTVPVIVVTNEEENEANKIDAEEILHIHGSTSSSYLRARSLSQSSGSQPKYAAWTSADVAKWLQKKQLHLVFGSKLKRFDGPKLRTLFKMKEEAPSFFYKALKEHVGGSLPDFLELVAALDKLNSQDV